MFDFLKPFKEYTSTVAYIEDMDIVLSGETAAVEYNGTVVGAIPKHIRKKVKTDDETGEVTATYDVYIQQYELREHWNDLLNNHRLPLFTEIISMMFDGCTLKIYDKNSINEAKKAISGAVISSTLPVEYQILEVEDGIQRGDIGVIQSGVPLRYTPSATSVLIEINVSQVAQQVLEHDINNEPDMNLKMRVLNSSDETGTEITNAYMNKDDKKMVIRLKPKTTTQLPINVYDSVTTEHTQLNNVLVDWPLNVSVSDGTIHVWVNDSQPVASDVVDDQNSEQSIRDIQEAQNTMSKLLTLLNKQPTDELFNKRGYKTEGARVVYDHNSMSVEIIIVFDFTVYDPKMLELLLTYDNFAKAKREGSVEPLTTLAIISQYLIENNYDQIVPQQKQTTPLLETSNEVNDNE